MAIILTDHATPGRVVKSGSDSVNVPVGASLVVETTPDGAEVLSATCPAGKIWNARIIVEITETDA